jgi:5-methylthioadenosine/S-adenosylhomocysteine deaminase
MSDDDIEISALAGATEGARAGVTCFGDIGRIGHAGMAALKRVGLRGVVFQETEFSPDVRSADADFAKLTSKFRALRETKNELVEAGLSPHAPYTVSRTLFEKIARYASDEGIKVSIHAAESAEEDELMRNGEGFFSTVYREFNVEWTSPRSSSIDFLAETGILETRPLLAHCITVTADDIATIASTGSKIAHCPKSNAKFGHGYAPFTRFLESRIAVGLGSDSVASNNVCDMLEEARFTALAARNFHRSARSVKAREALETATLGGAKALGLDGLIGSLEPGKQADLTAVSLTDTAQQPVSDIHAALVFASNARDVSMTMVAGQEIFRDEQTMVDEERTKARLAEIAKKF